MCSLFCIVFIVSELSVRLIIDVLQLIDIILTLIVVHGHKRCCLHIHRVHKLLRLVVLLLRVLFCQCRLVVLGVIFSGSGSLMLQSTPLIFLPILVEVLNILLLSCSSTRVLKHLLLLQLVLIHLLLVVQVQLLLLLEVHGLIESCLVAF